MIGSDDRAFEKRKCVFDGIRVDISANVHVPLVFNPAMLCSIVFRQLEIIGGVLVGHDRVHVFCHAIRNDIVKSLCFGIFGCDRRRGPPRCRIPTTTSLLARFPLCPRWRPPMYISSISTVPDSKGLSVSS